MDSNSKVSILVPIYGVEKYIEQCAHSLFRQSYENIEYIFVNDCTPDRSIQVLQEVLEAYPERKEGVKIVEHSRNKGLSSARNTAYEASTGDYVMHVDSDDFLDVNAVETCVSEVQATQADLVRLAVCRVYADREQTDIISFKDKEEYLRQVLRRKTAVSVWGTLYKRSLIEESKVRSIDQVNFGEDYCTFPRVLFFAKRVSFVTDAKYYYVMNNTSSLTNVYSHKNYLDIQIAIGVLHSFFSESSREKYWMDYQKGALSLISDMLGDTLNPYRSDDFKVLRELSSKYDWRLDEDAKNRLKLRLLRGNHYILASILYKALGLIS